jgi:hypothetical protein
MNSVASSFVARLIDARAPTELVSVEPRIHHHPETPPPRGPQPSSSRLSQGFITTTETRRQAAPTELASVEPRIHHYHRNPATSGPDRACLGRAKDSSPPRNSTTARAPTELASVESRIHHYHRNSTNARAPTELVSVEPRIHHYRRISTFARVVDQFKHESYSPEIQSQFRDQSFTCSYRQALFSFLEVDLNSGQILISGCVSNWVGSSPAELGKPNALGLESGKQIFPAIRSRNWHRA